MKIKMNQDIILPKNANQKENDWATLCHLLALTGLFFPFFNIGAPLVMWLLKKDESYNLDQHGREVLNFQISWTIYIFISFILVFVLVGLFMLFILVLSSIILSVIGALKARQGELYRYPITIRFL